MTRREQSLASLVGLAVLCAWAAVMSAYTDDACNDMDAGTQEPIPGTARADYCDTVESIGFTPLLVVLPTALAAVALIVLRHRPRALLYALVVLALAPLLNAMVVHGLSPNDELV